jgi:hypothetical protein
MRQRASAGWVRSSREPCPLDAAPRRSLLALPPLLLPCHCAVPRACPLCVGGCLCVGVGAPGMLSPGSTSQWSITPVPTLTSATRLDEFAKLAQVGRREGVMSFYGVSVRAVTAFAAAFKVLPALRRALLKLLLPVHHICRVCQRGLFGCVYPVLCCLCHVCVLRTRCPFYSLCAVCTDCLLYAAGCAGAEAGLRSCRGRVRGALHKHPSPPPTPIHPPTHAAPDGLLQAKGGAATARSAPHHVPNLRASSCVHARFVPCMPAGIACHASRKPSRSGCVVLPHCVCPTRS